MHKKAMEMAKHAMEDACAKGYDCMTSQDWDNFKDCVETAEKMIKAEYYYLIVEEMKEYKEEEEAEEKHVLKMLKEEHGMSDDESKRYYDSWRYASGRFAPKGRGSYMPRSSGRRGYEEPPYYHMTPEMMREHDSEYWRDLDRHEGRLYYTETAPHMAKTSDMGRMDGMRDHREGKSGMKRRGYMETKEMHKDSSPESKQHRMKDLEAYAKELTEDVVDMIADASAEEKSLLRAKLQTLTQKIQ